MNWKPVLRPCIGGYWPGFISDREYLFRRGEGEKIQRFRLSDQSDYFNVWGLEWAEIPNNPWDAFVAENGIKAVPATF